MRKFIMLPVIAVLLASLAGCYWGPRDRPAYYRGGASYDGGYYRGGDGYHRGDRQYGEHRGEDRDRDRNRRGRADY